MNTNINTNINANINTHLKPIYGSIANLVL